MADTAGAIAFPEMSGLSLPIFIFSIVLIGILLWKLRTYLGVKLRTDPDKILKEQLTELGFNMLFDVNDRSSPWFRHAIREFQIYAGFPQVARVKQGSENEPRWLHRLESVKNDKCYTGLINGIYNENEIQPYLDHWINNKYRCPVVAEIFLDEGKKEQSELGSAKPNVIRGNYWRYDDPRIEAFVTPLKDKKLYRKLRVRITDLTGHFEPIPKEPVKSGGIFKLGEWIGGFIGNSGPFTSTAEVTPENLIGKPWKGLSDDAKSTFRVIRAVSEHECFGYLESLNGYDNAWMSLGPCHWTLALAKNSHDDAGAGELPAFLAYWNGTDEQDAEAKLINPFGVTPKPEWIKGKPPKKPGSTLNYTGHFYWQAGSTDGTAKEDKISKIEDLNWFRTTHWFWRFLALARNVESFRLRQWHMTRLRLRDILDYQIDPSDRPNKDKKKGLNKVSVSQLVTSAAAVAILLRCHIRKSNFLDESGFSTPSLRMALAFANISEGNPGNWTDSEEKALIEGLVASTALARLPINIAKKLKKLEVNEYHTMRSELATMVLKNNALHTQCGELLNWPIESKFKWGHPVSGRFELPECVAKPPLGIKRNSFKFDNTDLPT